MDAEQIEALYKRAGASLEQFKSSGAETDRIKALEEALQVARALERPRDAILKLAYTVSQAHLNGAECRLLNHCN